MGERLRVLDDGRLVMEAALGRIGRADDGHAAVALQGRDSAVSSPWMSEVEPSCTLTWTLKSVPSTR